MATPMREHYRASLALTVRWDVVVRTRAGCTDRLDVVRPGRASSETGHTPWLEDECDTEPGNKNKHAPIADLYASWSKYCQDNGEQPGSKKDLGDELVSRGFERGQVGHAKTRSHYGIRLLRSATSDFG
jgi:hypothetical protein